LEIYKYLPESLVLYLKRLDSTKEITEIRIRKNKSVQLTVYGNTVNTDNLIVSEQELEEMLYRMCNCSLNIYDEEISNGYITLNDGCRVGLGGEYYYNPDTERYVLKELVSLNIRIAGDMIRFENQDKLFAQKISGILIVGPPHSGKTSLLKLMAEYLSADCRVSLCDERKELYTGNVNADVIQGIKKPVAISMATRTLNPQYIICDEIGLKEEAEEILSAVNTGVNFICSAHAETINQVFKRPNIKILIENGVFEKMVLVSQKNKKFYIEEIVDV